MSVSSQNSLPMSNNLAQSNSIRNHNACDECRARKLKCTGEAEGCSRCRTDGVQCIYSPRKQMGRPRKKRRDDGSQPSPSEQWGFGDSVSELASSSAQADSTRAPPYSDFHAPQSPTMFPEFNTVGGSASNSMDFGFSGMHINYMSAPQASTASYELSPPNLGLDYTQGFNNTSFLSNGQTWPSSPPAQYPTTTQSNGFSSAQGYAPIPNQLPTPPSTTLDLTSPTSLASCGCLPPLYKTLSEFPPSVAYPSFPASLTPLKRAIYVAQACLTCRFCGMSYNSALQNSNGLVTLLQLLIHMYARILHNVDAEVSQMGTSKVSVRMGELQNQSIVPHLHTGTSDCPMGLTVDFSGAEWRNIARKAVSRDVWGTAADQADTVVNVLHTMAERQKLWHNHFAPELPHHRHNHQQGPGPHGSNDICVQSTNIDNLRRSIDELGLRATNEDM